VATSRPSTLDPSARVALRYAPGGSGAFLQALDAALGGPGDLAALASAAGALEAEVRAVAGLLATAGEDVVVVWGERLAAGPGGADALRALLNVAERLRLAGSDGAGLLEIPAATNGRGLREAGALPNAGPGYGEPGATGAAAGGIAAATERGELTALYLMHADPLRDAPDTGLWERALARAGLVVAHAALLTEGLHEHADVVFPAEAYAEKEGTMVHPDGRMQRLRPAIGRPADVRAEWQLLAELSRRLGHDLDVLTGPGAEGVAGGRATAQLVAAVPFYAGLTLESIGGRGIRWPESVAAVALPAGDAAPFALAAPAPLPRPAGGVLRLGTHRSIWAAPEVETSPALKFLAARQRAELSPADAARLGIGDGEPVAVSADGTRVEAEAVVRAAVPVGTVFLEEGTATSPANALTAALVEVAAR
jgi:NADH-quinone oxidoreductase subunit G